MKDKTIRFIKVMTLLAGLAYLFGFSTKYIYSLAGYPLTIFDRVHICIAGGLAVYFGFWALNKILDLEDWSVYETHN